ncbi:MAG: glycosyltransferase [Candidatus Omnitrophota bacterium]|nr:MAG: glycosyltransferase [Candidatus Omnitrophota bacterium]
MVVPEKNTKIRVILLTSDSEICGAERILLSVLRHIDRERFQPSLVTLFGPGDLCREVEAMGIPAMNLRLKEDFFLSGLRRWWNFVNEFQPHLLLSVLIHSNLLGRATVFLRPDIAMLSGISTVYTIEGYGYLYAWLERLTHPLDTLYIVNSELGMEKVVNVIGLPTGKLELVHNGIETDVFPDHAPEIRAGVRREFGFEDDHVVVGIVAQLRPAKRHDILIRAAAQLADRFPTLRLLIVGTGENERKMMDFAHSEGIAARTVFTGYRPDARKLLQGMDIFALPSIVEGEPVSLMEAMDAGLPIAAAAAGGIPEIVEHGVSGLLSVPGDLAGFIHILETLLSNATLRQTYGRQARERVRRRFSAKRMSEEFQECCLRCARELNLVKE